MTPFSFCLQLGIPELSIRFNVSGSDDSDAGTLYVLFCLHEFDRGNLDVLDIKADGNWHDIFEFMVKTIKDKVLDYKVKMFKILLIQLKSTEYRKKPMKTEQNTYRLNTKKT